MGRWGLGMVGLLSGGRRIHGIAQAPGHELGQWLLGAVWGRNWGYGWKNGSGGAVRAVRVRGQGWDVGRPKEAWLCLPISLADAPPTFIDPSIPPSPPLPHRHRPRPPWPVSGLGSESRTEVQMI